ncbi:hypothetical protein ABW19_dt0201545 [Dactylella cylindrospora]|nr:hypothetical protein ABW19_dt0201545 [Dactylella cylindrospora]
MRNLVYFFAFMPSSRRSLYHHFTRLCPPSPTSSIRRLRHWAIRKACDSALHSESQDYRSVSQPPPLCAPCSHEVPFQWVCSTESVRISTPGRTGWTFVSFIFKQGNNQVNNSHYPCFP